MRGKHLLDQRGPGTWRAENEDRLRHVAAQARVRQLFEPPGVEEILHRPVERRDAGRIVGDAPCFGGELALALRVISPGLRMTPSALVQAATLEPAVAIQGRRRLDDGERFGIAARSRQVLRTQQVHRGRRGRCLGGVEQPLRAREVALHLAELRPVRQNPQRARREAVGLRKNGFRFPRAALLHQVEREVCKRLSLRAAKLERAAEVPFARGQVVRLGQERAKLVVQDGIAGMRDNGAAREGERIRAPAVAREQGDKVDESPVSAAIVRNDVLQRPGRAREIPARNRIAHARNRGFNRLGHFLRAPPGMLR